MAPKSIDALANRFMVIANKPKLTKAERNESRQLMGLLKQAGLNNEEISKLSGGRWSPNTIKYYTPGKVSHPTQYDDVVELLEKLKSSGLTLEDVETTLAIHNKVKSSDVTLDGIIDMLFAVESSSLDVADLVHQQEVFNEQGLSPEKLAEVYIAKKELEAKGFGLDSLVPLREAANTYGDAPKLLEAVSAYGSLLKLNDQVEAAKANLEELHAAKDNVDHQIKEREDELGKLAAPIDAYHKAVELGFNEQVLAGLAELSERFGGPKAVVQALKAYADYKDIDANLIEAKNQLADAKSEISKVHSEYGHLTTGINICLKLVKEYGFGIDAIDTLLSAVKKYVDPVEVLKAVEDYGRIEALQEEEEKLRGNIAGLKQAITELNREYEDGLNRLQSLNALAVEVGVELGKAYSAAGNSIYFGQLLKLINDPFTADFGSNVNVVMIMALCLKNFVTKHEANFKHRYSIKEGLAFLIADLGGVHEAIG